MCTTWWISCVFLLSIFLAMSKWDKYLHITKSFLTDWSNSPGNKTLLLTGSKNKNPARDDCASSGILRETIVVRDVHGTERSVVVLVLRTHRANVGYGQRSAETENDQAIGCFPFFFEYSDGFLAYG